MTRPPYLVVDSSVSLKWALDDEEDTDNALALRNDGIIGRFQMVAPVLWAYEVANGLVTAVRRDRITPSDGLEALAHLTDLGVRLADPEEVACYRTALRFGIAAYDAAYLALAEKLGAVLWTGDHKLWEAVGSTHSFVRWIGDYPA